MATSDSARLRGSVFHLQGWCKGNVPRFSEFSYQNPVADIYVKSPVHNNPYPHCSSSPAGHGGAKGHRNTQGTGDGHRNTAHIPTSNPVCTATTCIFRSEGCASATWWYATPHKSAEYAVSDPIPCSTRRMSSRIFIFSNFYRGRCTKL